SQRAGRRWNSAILEGTHSGTLAEVRGQGSGWRKRHPRWHAARLGGQILMATIIDIADSVVAELNATTFSQPVTAVRYYAPQFDIDQMSALHVSVVPKGLSSKSLDRSRDTFDYLVDVAVQ